VTRLHVCTLGAYDPAYPRNLILRRGLAMADVGVSECNAPRECSTLRKVPILLRQFRSLQIRPDAIVLAEFGQALAPLAWWLARQTGARLVVDAFTSIYDSAVWDRGSARPGSAAARRYALIDRAALRLADLILTDTAQHRDYFVRTFGAPQQKFAVIPVGASREWFTAPDASGEGNGLLAQFYGSYIPLHGVEVILQAIGKLGADSGLRFELVGRGQTYAEARALADTLGLSATLFREPVAAERLPALVARADISLGIFGTTPKAARVIPNKVFQTLALGKPVITADTPALRECFTPGEHLLATPPGDAEALAESIRLLAGDEGLRAALGKGGRERAGDFTEETLGRRLAEQIEALCT
jgi:glycosyltransferase involved in cell wall biosynthesis